MYNTAAVEMDDFIIKYISAYIELNPEEEDIIRNQNLIKPFVKDTILLAEGEHARECYFVLKGCVRRYYIINGEERTTEFYTENQSIIPVSYTKKKPSEYFLSCVEDTVIALGSNERNEGLIKQIPKLETMLVQMASEMQAQNQVEMDNFKNLNPEERYLNLTETRPDLLNRVPLNYIATYLGITPESLSRIRKRISRNH